jgi:type IV secretory pathway TraG/TraD family ATPase VirD4
MLRDIDWDIAQLTCNNEQRNSSSFHFTPMTASRCTLHRSTNSRPSSANAMNLGKDFSTGNDISLSTDALRRHVYIIGKSGVGKSALLEHLALTLIEEGYGVGLLDPHGDLVQKVADCMPVNRTQDTIYWEPFDTSHIIGFNPLKDIDKDNRPLVAENVISAFSHVWGLNNQHTPRLLHILRNSIRLLLDNSDTSLIDLQPLLTDSAYRHKLLRHSTDVTVTAFWEAEFESWNDRQRGEYIASLQNKVGALVSNPAMRGILSHSAIHPQTIMDTGKVLLVNLAKGKLGEESSALLGALLTTGFAQAAYSRGENRRDFVLIIDEFQSFTTTAFAQILSEARKYGLSLVVAHQFLSQVPDYLQDAVIGTANTVIVFRCGAKDAPLLAAELDLDQPRQLKYIPNYRAILRTPDNLGVRHMATYPPQPPGKRLAAVRRRTRARYGLTQP